MNATFESTTSLLGVRYRRISLLAGRAVIVIGVLVLVGWVFDIAALKSVVPGLVTMKGNTALCFILSGIAMALFREDARGPHRYGLAASMACAITALAMMTLAEYYFDRSLGIDELLFRDAHSAGISIAPGRMALSTALGFTLLGISLLLMARNSAAAVSVAQWFAFLGGFNALLAIAGYLYRAPSLIDISIRGVRSYMAANTAVAFGILTLGILASRPDAGFMATVTSPNAGGVSARRLLPFAFLVPLTLGWVRLQGQIAGLYGTNFGLVIFAVSNIFVFTIVILFGAKSLNRTAAARNLAESALRTSEERYRALFDYAPDGIIIADSERNYLDANASICRMLGYSHEELLALHASDIVVRGGVQSVGQGPAVIAANRGDHGDWQFRRKDGSVFEAEVIASTMPNGNLMGMIRDITERKRTEQALHEKELLLHAADRRLAEMVHGMTEACFALDAEWRFTFLNESSETLFQRARGELLGRAIWDAFPQLLGTSMETHYRSAMVERVPVSFEAFSSLAGRWLEVRLFPTVEGIAAFLLDIHARKLSEEASRASEEQFRTMSNSIPQLAWMAHADGSIFWYNQRWYDYTGKTPQEMEGWGWQSVHDPDVLPSVLEGWRNAIATAQSFAMEFPLRGADGHFRAFLTRVHPMMDSSGAVVRWFGTNTDVDEIRKIDASLRDIQARLSSALSAGSIGTWTWDIVNDRLVADEFTAGMFSIAPEAAASGLPASDYLGSVLKEDQPGVAEALARAIDSCGHYDIEYRIRRESGELFWLQARGRVEGDEAGKAKTFHGAVVDITARKHTDEALHQLNENLEQRVIERTAQLEAANRQLERTGRHKSEFLASMSHELRTPLNGIIGFTELLFDEKPGPLQPKQKEYLGDVLNSARHLLQLINDVLDMAKVESGKMELYPEIVSVPKAISEVVAVIEGMARKKQVGVTAETGSGLDAVLLDPQKFKQVLYNLLSNAVKFTNPGGKVTIHARRLEPDQLEVRVDDTGIGIKAEDLTRLFVEFAQLDSGASRRFEGTGLGLALTRKIVELQGGHIEVESLPDKGSTFTVVLPIVEDGKFQGRSSADDADVRK